MPRGGQHDVPGLPGRVRPRKIVGYPQPRYPQTNHVTEQHV